VQRASGSPFPWGTLAVNIAGSAAIGVLAALMMDRALAPIEGRLFLITGVLGGFTTFSAFSYETVALLRSGQWLAAAGYALGSVALGVLATMGAYAAASRLAN
jgi:CrcB protein